jgi:uncharacterized protein (DUF885 family)
MPQPLPPPPPRAWSPEEIHKVGLAQVADLSARLDKVLPRPG